MKIRWTRLAISDLDCAAEFIANDNPAAAESIIDRVQGALAALTKHPEIGRPGRVAGTVAGTRELVIAGTPFIVPYRIQGEEIHLLAFIHAKRKWPESFMTPSI